MSKLDYWLQRFANDRLTLLLIEDDAVERESLAALFREIGASVICAPTAEIALEILSDRFDLALVNLCLPGMSGLEFIHAARKKVPDMPCCVVTGFDPGCLQKLGVTHVYTKPFNRMNRDLLLRDFKLTPIYAADETGNPGVSEGYGRGVANPRGAPCPA